MLAKSKKEQQKAQDRPWAERCKPVDLEPCAPAHNVCTSCVVCLVNSVHPPLCVLFGLHCFHQTKGPFLSRTAPFYVFPTWPTSTMRRSPLAARDPTRTESRLVIAVLVGIAVPTLDAVWEACRGVVAALAVLGTPRRRLRDGLHLPLGVLVHGAGVRPQVRGWRRRHGKGRRVCPLSGRHCGFVCCGLLLVGGVVGSAKGLKLDG